MDKPFIFHVICWLLAAGLISGCYYRPAETHYFLSSPSALNSIGTIAVIELNNMSGFPQISRDMTESLYQALQKKQLFSMKIIPQNDPQWRSLQLDLGSTYSLVQLNQMRNKLKTDAVLVGTITGYRPYPHMYMAIQLKLLNLSDGRLVWAIDQVWDTEDKTVQKRINAYFNSQMEMDLVPLREKLIMVSPIKFAKFVAFEIAETLDDEN